jgi:hypothetical protein
MMNRLFDSPPPMPELVTVQRGAVKGQALFTWPTNYESSASRGIRFDRDHWPHFASDFIRYEQMVLAAHDQLFETYGHKFTSERLHQLLLDGLVVSTHAMPLDTAKVVGWAVSWLGPSQALAPHTGFTAPALGLTSWLTNLPVRKRHTSIKTWHEQVAQWLSEDLASSLGMWAEVTEFMSTRGHYIAQLRKSMERFFGKTDLTNRDRMLFYVQAWPRWKSPIGCKPKNGVLMMKKFFEILSDDRDEPGPGLLRLMRHLGMSTAHLILVCALWAVIGFALIVFLPMPWALLGGVFVIIAYYGLQTVPAVEAARANQTGTASYGTENEGTPNGAVMRTKVVCPAIVRFRGRSC